VTRQSRARTNTAILAEGIIALGVVGARAVARVITTRRRDTCACHALQALLMLALLSLPVLPLGALPRSIDAAACMTAVEPMRRHGLPAYGSVRDGWSGGRRPHSTQRGGGGAGAVARACNSAAAGRTWHAPLGVESGKALLQAHLRAAHQHLQRHRHVAVHRAEATVQQQRLVLGDHSAEVALQASALRSRRGTS